MRWVGDAVRIPCLAALLAATFLVGCSRQEDPRTVRLWHQMRPGDRAMLVERIAAFHASQDKVRVVELYKETEELRSGLESAVLVGRGPDIVYGPSDPIGVYDEIGALQDLRTWFDEAELSAFDPNALVASPATESEGGERLLMLGDRFGNHLALVYNRAFVPEPPADTDALVAVAKANTVDNDGDGRRERYGMVWNYTEPFFVVPFLTGYGAWFFDEELESKGVRLPALDTPEAQAAYEFVSSLKSEHDVLPPSADYESASALFLAGKAAMLIDGDWSWQRYLDSDKVDAAVAPLPTVASTGLPMGPAVAPKGYSLSVVAQGERAERAVEAIRFLTGAETQTEYLRRRRVWPSRVAVRDASLLAADPTLAASVEQMERGRPMPTALEMRAVWDAMRGPFEQLMAGTLTVTQATAAMQRDALARIDTLKQSIEPDATAPLVIGLGFVALAAALWGLWRWWKVARADFGHNRLAYAMAAPSMLLIFLVVVFPLAYNVAISFSNMSLQNFDDWRIVGLHNYVSVFVGGASGEFWRVFFLTVLWTVVNVVLHVAIGVFLAVVINGPVRGKSVYRLLLVIPWAVPAYITALTWRGMFDAEFGAVNQLVRDVNTWLPAWLDLPMVNWLGEPWPAFAACIVANVWLGFPFMMVIALGGLQGIPQDMYEAARIDRATRWQQFWHITVPMLRPVMLPAIVLGSVWTFNNLNVVWLVSNGGEPADQTHILVSYVYRAVFNLYQYGYGAALSMVIFALLLAFSVTFLRQTRAAEGV